MTNETNPPGLSSIYAAARQMLDAIAPGDSPSMGRAGGYVGTCHASVTRYANEWALELIDVHRIERSALTTWAAAVGVSTPKWRTASRGKIARLEWVTDGEARGEGGRVTWIGGKP